MHPGYFDINLDIGWETVQKSLPEVECQLNAALRSCDRAD